jgi:hypothetical protein
MSWLSLFPRHDIGEAEQLHFLFTMQEAQIAGRTAVVSVGVHDLWICMGGWNYCQ